MFEVRLTLVFTRWLEDLRDSEARNRIVARLRRFELGNLGDSKSVGGGVSESRIDYGPGYRLYYVRRAEIVIVMLCGGDKSSQRRDIARAKQMARET